MSKRSRISCLPNIMGCWRIWNRTRHFVEKVVGEKTPKFNALLAVLEREMQQYRSKRAARPEFKAVKQLENESLKDYFRRVRYLGDSALSEKSLTEMISIHVISFWMDCSTSGCNRNSMKTKQTAIFAILRSIIQGPRTRAHPEKFWTNTRTTAVAFLGCEIDRSRITRSLWEKESSLWPWE